MNFEAMRKYVEHMVRTHPQAPGEEFLRCFDAVEKFVKTNQTEFGPKVLTCIFAGLSEQLKKEEKWPEDPSSAPLET